MTSPSCTRRLELDYGHRVYRHESKCNHLHGHRGVVELTARAALDELGRVIDFGVLKAHVGGWLDEHWDHGMILWREDPLALAWPELEALDGDGGPEAGLKLFQLPWNPTAENLARYLGEVVCPDLLYSSEVVVSEVTFWETPNCRATWRL